MKRMLSIFLTVFMLTGLLVGCKGNSTSVDETTTVYTNSTDSSSTSSATDVSNDAIDIWKPYGETVTVAIGRSGSTTQYNFTGGDTATDNAYTRWIKDKLNIKVELEWFVTQDYTQKINLAIASGDIPDVMLGNDKAQLAQLIDSDMIQDLTQGFKDYASPLLKDMVDSFGGVESAWAPAISDGNLWALCSLERLSQYAITWIRKDWMKKVGAKPPETIDELIVLAHAFIDADLGGKGTTVGIEVAGNGSMLSGNYNSLASLDPIFNYYQSYPQLWYKDDSGKYIYGSIAPGTKKALTLLADMYHQGILDPEFSTKEFQASIASGKSGILFGPWWLSNWPLGDCRNNDPTAEWFPYKCLLSEDGLYHTYMPNTVNGWVVVNKDYEHPEIAVKLLNLDADIAVLHAKAKIGDQTPYNDSVIPNEVADAYSGVAGIDWGSWPFNITLCYKDQIVKNAKLSSNEYERFQKGDTSGIAESDLKTYKQIKDYKDGVDKSKEAWNSYTFLQGKKLMIDMVDCVKVLDNYYPPVTKTMELKWTNLKTLESTAFLKIIMGLEKVDYFDKFVSEWKAQGGDEITKEVNDIVK